MNNQKIGRKFEREALCYLKKKFDSVDWLSKDEPHSTFDFKCIKDGQTYFGDAKVVNFSNTPCLNPSQQKADFVIAKIRGTIKLIFMDDFSGNIGQRKCILKSITITKEQDKYIRDKCINLSWFIQKKIEEERQSDSSV